jgi:Ca-activated chloride channel family protein
MTMPAARLCAIALLLDAAALLAVAQSPKPPTFQASVHTVSLYATVRDREGRLVPNLTSGDFEVRDSGRPVEISVFSSEVQPITVVVLLDMSGSMANRVLRVRDGAIHFVQALRDGDRARIGTFGEELAISPWLTGDKRRLEQILREELWPGGSTPLWGSLDAALASLEREDGRRVVLTLTDGVATGTLPGYNVTEFDVSRRVLAGNFMLYAIGLARGDVTPRTAMTPPLDPRLVRLIERTGGAHFELADNADLETTFSRVADELRRQYLIGFTQAATDGRTRKIDVRTRDRALRVRARDSYVAGGAR